MDHSIKRRGFMLVMGAGGAVVALAGCDTMPFTAVQAWQGPDASEADPRLRALSWAMLAPNPHNLQSWIADVREPGLIKLHIDPTRLLPQTDPPARQTLIGCGATLRFSVIRSSGRWAHAVPTAARTSRERRPGPRCNRWKNRRRHPASHADLRPSPTGSDASPSWRSRATGSS